MVWKCDAVGEAVGLLVVAVCAFVATHGSVRAQCPHEGVRLVDGGFTTADRVSCGGGTFTFQGFGVSHPVSGCPRAIVWTPPHNVVVPARCREVYRVGRVQASKDIYSCDRCWWLFSSCCNYVSTVVVDGGPDYESRICRPCDEDLPAAVTK